MKKVTCIYLPSCPYCKQATVCLNELIEENPEYGKVEFEYINEMEDPEIADQYDYWANPSMFIGKEKIYEAHLFETKEECKAHVEEVLKRALES